MHHDLVRDITLCILFAWALGLVAYVSRQPLILAYLIAGFVIGPTGMRWVESQESIHTISELGLIFLLFMIGLEIDLKKIIRAGRVILGAAASQLLGGCVAGIVFFLLLGFAMDGDNFDALYLTVATVLSSTVIIVKILAEKHELDTLPGRVTLGVLVLQDIFAILFLAVQPSLDNLQFGVFALSFARVAALVAISLLLSRYVLPTLFHRIARRPELILLGGLAWCFFIAQVAVALDLSREMGALIAGVSLSTFPYALDVTAKITTLRDFFITLFFVALGMTIPIPTMDVLSMAVVIAVFTVISRLITTFLPLYFMKQGLRASLLPAINLAQISEFSLVVIQVGVASNQIAGTTASALTFAFVILAVLSTFAMMRSDDTVRFLIVFLKRLGVRDLDHSDEDASHGEGGHGAPRRIVLLGFYRAASSLIAELEAENKGLLADIGVVDYNPHVYASLNQRGVQVVYGDISNLETLQHAGLDKAQIVISSIPDSILKGVTNERLVRFVRGLNPTAKIIATADMLSKVEELYAAGADYVSVPRLADAHDLVNAIAAAEKDLLQDSRELLDRRLKKRIEILP